MAFLFTAAIGFWSGCAGTRTASPTKPAIVASSKEAVYVALPIVPAAVDSMMSGLGWSPGRFAQELRKEMIFQLNRKGLATLGDTAGTKSSLAVDLSVYTAGGTDPAGAPSTFKGDALLKTSAGERRFAFSKVPKRAEPPERADPTVDNIRLIAESVLAEACKAPETKKRPAPEPIPPLMMIF